MMNESVKVLLPPPGARVRRGGGGGGGGGAGAGGWGPRQSAKSSGIPFAPPKPRVLAKGVPAVAPAIAPAVDRADATAAAAAPRKLRKVALLIETSGSYGRGLLRGIARYNRDHGGWSTYFRPHGLADPVPDWLKSWNGDGILARLETPEMARMVRRSGVPVVNLRGTMKGLEFPYVSVDHKQVVELALNHLRERVLRHFAFCGRPGSNNPALHERCQHFRALVEQAGGTCWIFPAPPPEATRRNGSGAGVNGRAKRCDWDAEQDRLADWIRSLPKPVGIMACNDERGLEVLDACRRCGAAVPEEVAVIGVDNDQAICDLGIPPLTSIDVNAEAIGYEAAALLDRMMSGQPAPTEPLQLAPRAVVARASTDLVASEDQEVGRALSYIRANACHGLQVSDVLGHMAMSRAALQQRMKQVSGRTIHQEIQRVRLSKVKDLLTMTDLTIKQVARDSGFASVQYMTRVFRATTGETPARFRLRRTMSPAPAVMTAS
jgi:LacI family transcriptional regulator